MKLYKYVGILTAVAFSKYLVQNRIHLYSHNFQLYLVLTDEIRGFPILWEAVPPLRLKCRRYKAAAAACMLSSRTNAVGINSITSNIRIDRTRHNFLICCLLFNAGSLLIPFWAFTILFHKYDLQNADYMSRVMRPYFSDTIWLV
jgi:hypothetical protein